MAFTICEKRQSVIDEQGHALVIGGPGSGKTTLALLKCKGILDTLAPGQSILFLSFSRAAVQQILKRCREILTKDEMKCIDVRTYHSFCWDILHCHGRLLGGRPLKMMAPSEEGTRRTQFGGDWAAESRRLKDEDVSMWDAYREHLTWPLRPVKAKGRTFNLPAREAAGLDPDFIRRLEASEP